MSEVACTADLVFRIGVQRISGLRAVLRSRLHNGRLDRDRVRYGPVHQRFLDLLEQASPTVDIYVVTDNLSSHDSKSTREWLVDHPGSSMCSSRSGRTGSISKNRGGGSSAGRRWPGRPSLTRRDRPGRRCRPRPHSTPASDHGSGAGQRRNRGCCDAVCVPPVRNEALVVDLMPPCSDRSFALTAWVSADNCQLVPSPTGSLGPAAWAHGDGGCSASRARRMSASGWCRSSRMGKACCQQWCAAGTSPASR